MMHTKYKLLMAGLAAGVLAVGCSNEKEKVEFRCLQGLHPKQEKYVPTTFAWTKRGKSPVIRWVRTDFQAAEYDPEKRCRQVSPRFQEAYENGSFKYLTNGRMNEQPVICTARVEGGDCDTLLFTLLHKDDEFLILADLKAVLRGRSVDDSTVLNQSGQIYIEVDIDEFLRTAPVEEEPVSSFRGSARERGFGGSASGSSKEALPQHGRSQGSPGSEMYSARAFPGVARERDVK